jgi:AraC-like DNA-binding protein
LTFHSAYLLLESIGLFALLLIGAHEIVSRPKLLAAHLFALLCLNSMCARILARSEYGEWIPGPYRIDLGWLAEPMDLARNLTPGIFMILCHALFQDRPRMPLLLSVLFGAQVILDDIAPRMLGAPGIQTSLFNALPALLQLLFVAIGIYWIVSGWRADVIENRRKLRWIYLLLFGTLVFVMVLLERLLLSWHSAAIFQAHVALSILGTCFAVSALVMMLRSSAAIFVDPVYARPTPRKLELPPPVLPDWHRQAAIELLRLLRNEHVYREPGLTIGELAARMRLPEYRLRRVIHHSLGYRNFNSMLHDFRIEAAATLLRDRSKRPLPILTIALTVGYGSINPFNRAFREIKGVAPSAFRHQPPESPLDASTTLTDS